MSAFRRTRESPAKAGHYDDANVVSAFRRTCERPAKAQCRSEIFTSADPAWAVSRRKPSEQAALASDGTMSRRRRNPRGVTKWGPTVSIDKPPQGRCSGLRRQGFRSEMARAAARSEFPKGIGL